MIKIHKDWNFPDTQYVREETAKKQIVLHHTVSGDSVNGDMSWWLHTTERVATAYVISREGHLHRCFDDRFTQHTDGKFYPITTQNGKVVPNLKCKPVRNIYEYCTAQKYRGFQYFERYTTAQLDTLGELLRHLMETHRIKPNYQSDIWNVTPRALLGQEGIFAHASYRQDKSDAHPQVELVNLLKSL